MLTPWKESYDQPREHIKKQRHYFANKGLSTQGYGFSSGLPQTARRSNQSILKEISPGCSLEGLMLKLKLQHFGHLMQRVDSLEGLGAGGEGDYRGGWHHRLDGHEFG